MKITVKTCEVKYSIKFSDDVVFNEFMDKFKDLCKSIYSEKTVDEYWE